MSDQRKGLHTCNKMLVGCGNEVNTQGKALEGKVDSHTNYQRPETEIAPDQEKLQPHKVQNL